MSIEEYLSLWREHGIEDVLNLKKKAGLVIARHKPQRQRSLETLEDVQQWLGACKRCGLCEARTKIVFGTGNPKAQLVFVGEGPGADEDAQGLPFVGRAGQLLTRIIEAMGYNRADVYIANVVKCRPPGNRTPLPEEIEQCFPFLKAQLDLISPRVVVALGLTAARALIGSEMTMGNLRGRFHSLHWNEHIPVMPTYHPAYLLRNPEAKKIVWEDVKKAKTKLETSL